jgi:diguanylate cyclase (GGDEF)-like protein
MVSNKARWGTSFCVAALVLFAGLCYVYQALPAGRNPALYQKELPAVGLIFSCFMLFLGHFSYSRLHSVRLYFLGYGAGCTGIINFTLYKAFFQTTAFPALPHGFRELIILIAFINLIAVTLIPSGTKFRAIKSLTLSVTTVETVLLCTFRFGHDADLWLKTLLYHTVWDPAFWIGPVFFTAVLILSLWKIRNEFFLGGIVAGCAALLLVAWASRLFASTHPDLFYQLIFTGTSAYLLGCMVIHGFFRVEHHIAYDPLLKIYNRDYCSRIITEQANLNVAPPFGVAMVDIDHFKQVNDTYGHQAGDAVLHTVAQAVQLGTGPDGIACRYGGEELAIFFPQKTINEVAEIIEGIRKNIEETKTRFNKKTIQVTISAGVSHREQYGQSIVDVIQAADKALYAAKEEGRNRVRSQKTPLKTR